MAIKYHFVLIAGLVVWAALVVAVILLKRGKRSYAGGKKVVGLMCREDNEYYKRKYRIYNAGISVIIVGMLLMVAAIVLLMAKPYTKERIQDERYCRDIMLCIDISTSVDYLNENLLDELKNTVDELKGERFGIVLFNTSPVMLTPLTDDYEYVKEQLDLIAKCLKSRNGNGTGDIFSGGDADWLYYEAYISSGTLVGNEERGSSLIGDGLAAAACDFSDTETDRDRTRVIIFSTDNDIQGNPVATLDEAAKLCVENNVVVYGIGTKEMTDENKASMKDAVEKTGGSFYLEEESGSFKDIVSEIEKMSRSLVKVSGIDVEYPELGAPFVMLIMLYILTLGVAKWLKI